MATENKKNKGHATGVGIGLGMIAALAAGAYFLYGSKDGAKRRVKIRGWMLKAKGEILEKIEKMKEVNEEAYNSVIASVMSKYAALKNVDKTEVAAMVSDMKKHWGNISRQIKSGGKSGSKSKPKLTRVSRKKASSESSETK